MTEETRRPSIHPKNLSAQLEYVGVGNPPASHHSIAISNSFPGLEMDFRNVWRRIFPQLVLHEASNFVVSTNYSEKDKIALPDFTGHFLQSVNGKTVVVNLIGPTTPG